VSLLKLKACPFCGNDGAGPVDTHALHIKHTEFAWLRPRDLYSAQCDNCTATMGYSESEKEAADAWNTRADQLA
jgi:hypothetical protein